MSKYSHINFKPPQSVRDAYKRGLDLHEEGKTGSGLEASTVSMARKLSQDQEVSPEWARKGNRFWGRNERFLSEEKDSPAYASAMLWGGRAGKGWFSKLVEQMDAADKDMKSNFIQVVNKVDSNLIKEEIDGNGDKIIIIPSYTMPDDIVMNRIMYPAEEIAASYEGLSNIPAPIGHPHDDDGNYISATSELGINRFYGGAFNGEAKRKDGRIFVEKRVNVRMAEATEPGRRLLGVLRNILEGGRSQPIHTSTGVYIKSERLPTPIVNSDGKEYDTIARNLVYDHDAILFDEPGAATPEDGVGMMVNQGEELPVLRVHCQSIETTGHTSYHEDDLSTNQNEANMALADMLKGFLKANKVDVAEGASDATLLEHLNAMKTNAEITPVDFDKIIDEKLKPLQESVSSLTQVQNAMKEEMNEKDMEEKKMMMSRMMKNGDYSKEDLEKMDMKTMRGKYNEMMKKGNMMKKNSSEDADFVEASDFSANKDQEVQFSTNLDDWFQG